LIKLSHYIKELSRKSRSFATLHRVAAAQHERVLQHCFEDNL